MRPISSQQEVNRLNTEENTFRATYLKKKKKKPKSLDKFELLTYIRMIETKVETADFGLSSKINVEKYRISPNHPPIRTMLSQQTRNFSSAAGYKRFRNHPVPDKEIFQGHVPSNIHIPRIQPPPKHR